MKLGLIGTNFISDRLLEAAARVPAVSPTAVYSRTREKGGEFARRHGIPAVYTDLSAFLRSGIDAVYIASPNLLHASQTLQALEAGVHVLCEKPACKSLAEWQQIRAAVRRCERVYLEAMRPVHDPAWQQVRQLLPRLGPLRRVSLEYCQYSSRYDRFLGGEVLNAFDPTLANAAVMDIGVYPLHVLGWLFGEPRTLQASSVFLPGGFEGCGQVLCGYQGFTATVAYSKLSDSVTPSVLQGEQGSLLVDKVAAPTKLTLALRGEAEEILFPRSAENNMVYELQRFVALCEAGQWQHPHLAETQTELRLLDRVRAAAGIRLGADDVLPTPVAP